MPRGNHLRHMHLSQAANFLQITGSGLCQSRCQERQAVPLKIYHSLQLPTGRSGIGLHSFWKNFGHVELRAPDLLINCYAMKFMNVLSVARGESERTIDIMVTIPSRFWNKLVTTFEQLRGLHDFPIASSPRCTGMGINGPAQFASQFVCHKNMLGVLKSWPVPTWVCPLMTPNCHMFMCKMMTNRWTLQSLGYQWLRGGLVRGLIDVLEHHDLRCEG
jgi:hypothetical protein